MTKLNPYLNFAGNTEEAFRFYKSIFGGEFASVVRFKDMPVAGGKIPQKDENKILHIRLSIGKDLVLKGTDTLESLGPSLVQGDNAHVFGHPEGQASPARRFAALSRGA